MSAREHLRARLAAALVVLSVLAFGCGGKDGQQEAAAPASAEPAGAGASGASSSGPVSSIAGRSGASGPPASAGAGGSSARAGDLASTNAAAGSGGASPAAGSGGAPSQPPSAGAGGSAGVEVSGNAAAAGSGATGVESGVLPKVMDTDGPGPFETSVDLRGGPRGQSGVFRPDELGQGGLLHPVFIWGCGGMATPSSYMEELTQIASHGFVVVAEVSNIGDDGAPLLAALDWVLAENERSDSELYHKLDPTRIGLGGHSIGSVNSFLAGPDPRWKTTLHVAGGSLDNVNDPSAPTTGMGGKSLIHPTAYICSESDLFGNVEKTEKDYANTTVPVFFTIMAGTEHIGAVGEGLPVIIAWLRWQLGNEQERRADFLDPQGMFATGRYETQVKNW